MVEFYVVWVYIFGPCPLTLSLMILFLGHVVRTLHIRWSTKTWGSGTDTLNGTSDLTQQITISVANEANNRSESVLFCRSAVVIEKNDNRLTRTLTGFTIVLILKAIDGDYVSDLKVLGRRHRRSLIVSLVANNHCWQNKNFHTHTATVIIRVEMLLFLLLLSYGGLVKHHELT